MSDEKPTRPGSDLLSDLPIKDAPAGDMPNGAGRDGSLGLEFEFDGLARTLAGLVTNPANRTPFTVVVRGDWGRGKTTLLGQTRELLDPARERGGDYRESSRGAGARSRRKSQPSERRVVRTVWFNAWKYPSEESVLAGLLGALLDEIRTRGVWGQFKLHVADQSLPAAKRLIQRAVPMYRPNAKTRFSAADDARVFHDHFRRLFGQAWYVWQGAGSALSDLDGRPIDHVLGERQHTHTLAIFLDDLDRCADKRVLEVLQAINLFLDLPGVCFFLGLDWKRVLAILAKPENLGDEELAESFLEKMVQVSFELPQVTQEGVQQYVENLVVDSKLRDVLGHNTSEVQSPDHAPDSAARHAKGRALGSAGGPDATLPRKDALTTLASVMRSTEPRHVKRVLNDLSIRLAVMAQTGHLLDPEPFEHPEVAQPDRLLKSAVVAWHIVHEAATDAEWTGLHDAAEFRRFVNNYARLFSERNTEGAEASKPAAGTSPGGRGLLSKCDLSAQFEVLAGLTGKEVNVLLNLGSPPSPDGEEGPDAENADAGSGRDLAGVAAVQEPSSRPRDGSAESAGAGNRRDDRAAAAQDLKRLHGPAWVELSGGEFRMGVDPGDRDFEELFPDAPMHTVRVSDFSISKFPITNAQYELCVRDKGVKPPAHWADGRMPAKKADHPVVNVSWEDASAFCAWLNDRLTADGGGLISEGSVRLPTEAQWEFAARGTGERLYPWGNDAPTEEHANYGGNVGGTTAVDTYPKGATPAPRVWDMAGNVWEWCADRYGAYDPSAPEDPIGPETGESRVLRGGSFSYHPGALRASYRGDGRPGGRYRNVGFRVVWSCSGGQS